MTSPSIQPSEFTSFADAFLTAKTDPKHLRSLWQMRSSEANTQKQMTFQVSSLSPKEKSWKKMDDSEALTFIRKNLNKFDPASLSKIDRALKLVEDSQGAKTERFASAVSRGFSGKGFQSVAAAAKELHDSVTKQYKKVHASQHAQSQHPKRKESAGHVVGEPLRLSKRDEKPPSEELDLPFQQEERKEQSEREKDIDRPVSPLSPGGTSARRKRDHRIPPRVTTGGEGRREKSEGERKEDSHRGVIPKDIQDEIFDDLEIPKENRGKIALETSRQYQEKQAQRALRNAAQKKAARPVARQKSDSDSDDEGPALVRSAEKRGGQLSGLADKARDLEQQAAERHGKDESEKKQVKAEPKPKTAEMGPDSPQRELEALSYERRERAIAARQAQIFARGNVLRDVLEVLNELNEGENKQVKAEGPEPKPAAKKTAHPVVQAKAPGAGISSKAAKLLGEGSETEDSRRTAEGEVKARVAEAEAKGEKEVSVFEDLTMVGLKMAFADAGYQKRTFLPKDAGSESSPASQATLRLNTEVEKLISAHNKVIIPEDRLQTEDIRSVYEEAAKDLLKLLYEEPDKKPSTITNFKKFNKSIDEIIEKVEEDVKKVSDEFKERARIVAEMRRKIENASKQPGPKGDVLKALKSAGDAGLIVSALLLYDKLKIKSYNKSTGVIEFEKDYKSSNIK